MRIPILFENEQMVAVNKPEGLASIPERDLSQPNVVSFLSREKASKLYVVHRLDKEVSGVLMFAKDPDTHRYLNSLFLRQKVHKTYVAWVHGMVQSQEGRIEAPLRQFGSGRMGVDLLKGKPSVTEFSVIRTQDAYTFLKLCPRTGRRHQLRVHLYSIHHPIVGDPRYGDLSLKPPCSRLMLHAHQIEFPLASGEQCLIESPLPESFSQLS